jgi:hypothetical protein
MIENIHDVLRIYAIAFTAFCPERTVWSNIRAVILELLFVWLYFYTINEYGASVFVGTPYTRYFIGRSNSRPSTFVEIQQFAQVILRCHVVIVPFDLRLSQSRSNHVLNVFGIGAWNG